MSGAPSILVRFEPPALRGGGAGGALAWAGAAAARNASPGLCAGDSEIRGLGPVFDGCLRGGGGGTILGTSDVEWLGDGFSDEASEDGSDTCAVEWGFLLGGGGGGATLPEVSSASGG